MSRERIASVNVGAEAPVVLVGKEKKLAGATALIFGGQGSIEVGMGKELLESPDVQEFYKRVRKISGIPIDEITFLGPSKKLFSDQKITQLAVFALNHAYYIELRKKLEREPDFYAGNSLGRINALLAAGALEEDDAIRLVIARGRAMQKACRKNPGSLFALTMPEGRDGIKFQDIESLASDFREKGIYIEAVNSDSQIVVGCLKEKVDETLEWLKQYENIKVTPVKSAGIYHSIFMQPAVPELQKGLKKVKIKKPTRPVIDDLTGEPMIDHEEIRESLLRHLTNAVNWKAVVEFLEGEGVLDIVEPGSRGTLSRMMKHKRRIALVLFAGGTLAYIMSRRRKTAQ